MHLSSFFHAIFLKVGLLSQSHDLFSFALGLPICVCSFWEKAGYLNLYLHYVSLFCRKAPFPLSHRINSQPPIRRQKSFIIHNYYDNLNWYSIENASEIWGRKDFCYDSDFTLIPDNASIRHRPPRKKKEKSYKSNYISEFHFPSIKWGKCYLLYRLCA